MITHGIKLDECKDKNKVKTEKQVMECEYCDRKFKYKKSFTHHMMEEHGMLDDDIPLNALINAVASETESGNQSEQVDGTYVNQSNINSGEFNPDSDGLNTCTLNPDGTVTLNTSEVNSGVLNSGGLNPGGINSGGMNSALNPDGLNPDIINPNNIIQSGALIQNDGQTRRVEGSKEDEEDFGLTDTIDQIGKPARPQKIHTCHVCAAKFPKANHLTRHMTLHRAVLLFKCEKCEKAFATDEHLAKHMQEDHIDKPYTCTVCNKTFKRGEHLIHHLKVHKNPFSDLKCSICEQSFSKSELLARHIKVHIQQDKRHICAECGKAFNRLDNLKTHQRIHTGDKDTTKVHLCVYCGKEFNNSSNMVSLTIEFWCLIINKEEK